MGDHDFGSIQVLRVQVLIVGPLKQPGTPNYHVLWSIKLAVRRQRRQRRQQPSLVDPTQVENGPSPTYCG